MSLALFGMRSYWDRDDDVVAEIIKKVCLLPQQRRSFVLSVLMGYYEHADKRYGREGFARVEHLYFPNLKEEERLMPYSSLLSALNTKTMNHCMLTTIDTLSIKTRPGHGTNQSGAGI